VLQAEAGEKYYHQREVRGMAFRGQKSERNTIVLLASGSIELGPGAQLEIPALAIRPADRIAITGDNGAGKSTLLKHIRSRIDMPAERMIYIPQEIDEAEWQGVSHELASLPGSELGQLLSVVYRLGSEPERVLQSVSPSPGEKRKILLGLGLLKTPSLIMMDEPTNHMDMPSILCLEEALREFTGALLLVSHDADFISNVTDTEWALARDGIRSRLVVKM
jgi:ATPase subunit of ABC transporter with duplicated ATPase domains